MNKLVVIDINRNEITIHQVDDDIEWTNEEVEDYLHNEVGYSYSDIKHYLHYLVRPEITIIV